MAVPARAASPPTSDPPSEESSRIFTGSPDPPVAQTLGRGSCFALKIFELEGRNLKPTNPQISWRQFEADLLC